MPKKICHSCNEEKSTTDFYWKKYICKKCHIKKMGERQKKDTFFKTEAGRKAWNKASKKSRINHPERWRARTLLREAVRKGLLKRLPCEVCGREPSQGHHEDYNYPLSVIWYCNYHHIKRHEVIKSSK
jgi:hypothetical protein